MGRGTWLATVHGVVRVTHDLVTKPLPPPWDLNKASGCNEIPEELQILKGFAFIMSAILEDPTVATGLEKVNPHPNSQEGLYQRMC